MLMESSPKEEGVVKKRYQRRGGKTTPVEVQEKIISFMEELEKWEQTEDKTLGFLSLSHLMKLIDQHNQNRVLYLSRKEVEKEENERILNKFRGEVISGVFQTILDSSLVRAKPISWLFNKEQCCLPDHILTKSPTTFYRTMLRLNKGGVSADFSNVEFSRFLSIITRLDYRIHAAFWNSYLPKKMPLLHSAVHNVSKDNIKHHYWPYYISAMKNSPTQVMSLVYVKREKLFPVFQKLFDFNYASRLYGNALPSSNILVLINSIYKLLLHTESLQIGNAVSKYEENLGTIYRCWVTMEKNRIADEKSKMVGGKVLGPGVVGTA